MFKFALGILCFLAAAPAAAENWQVLEVFGDTPSRSITLMDGDAINRSDPQRPVIRNAVLYETALGSGVYQLVIFQQIDCLARTTRALSIEGRNSSGEVIMTEGAQEIEPIEAETVVDVYREAACENRWDLFAQSAGDKPLGLIAAETFGWYYE